MPAPEAWAVGQDVERVLIGDRTRRAHHEIDRTERIVKIARVWLTTVTLDHRGEPTRFETRYRVSTGHEDGRDYTPTYKITTPARRAHDAALAALQGAVEAAGWGTFPNRYSERPDAEWIAVARALGVTIPTELED